MSITVSNLNKKHKINTELVAALTRKILRLIKQTDVDLEIVFLDYRSIKSLNKRYKGSNRATDVLSFDLGSCGQILISSDTALFNSRIFRTLFENELILYVIHGILHLFGYDDGSPADRMKMFRKQSSILRILCANTKLSKVLTRR